MSYSLGPSKFGVYIHIPYCIQRCSYCDFATFEQSQILPPEEYIEVLLKEIQHRAHLFENKTLDTIYFGGGTPSLISPKLILSVINKLKSLDFKTRPDSELTIEINPATINDEKLDQYIDMGFNRFSVGAQTFDDTHLKNIKREHNSEQTYETLDLLKSRNLNFNFDILFALPHQTIKQLEYDLQKVVEIKPKHVSPYCLTVPTGHSLSAHRPSDLEQVEMFDLINKVLINSNYIQYEISNFSLPGFESKHNLLYWTDHEYWGLGLSAHSYSKKESWGKRFWNFSTLPSYLNQIKSAEPLTGDQFEVLQKHQSLTDFCHTSLRLSVGLSLIDLESKFGQQAKSFVEKKLIHLHQKNLVKYSDDKGRWSLTPEGIVISNQVFLDFTFLNSDLV